jgi:hypothetical protein
MLIIQSSLLVLALEALVSWCWFTTPVEIELIVLTHFAMIGGVGVAAWLQTRPPMITPGGTQSLRPPAAAVVHHSLKKAA